jgi:hypothetical protein
LERIESGDPCEDLFDLTEINRQVEADRLEWETLAPAKPAGDALMRRLMLPNSKGRLRRRRNLVHILLQRCTRRSLLEADVEANNLHTDKWVADSLWDGRFPPSHERHPWHSEFSKAREEELWAAPEAVDYGAERAAAKRRKL